MDIRNIPSDLAYACVAAQNQRQVDGLSTFFHLNRTESTDRSDFKTPSVTRLVVSSANATDETTLVVLANELKSDVNTHFADTTAHNTAVSAVIATAAATNVATANTLLNAIKAAYNTHRTESGVHYTNDSTNATAAANGTDETTGIALANELKADLNAHVASAPAGTFINIVEA